LIFLLQILEIVANNYALQKMYCFCEICHATLNNGKHYIMQLPSFNIDKYLYLGVSTYHTLPFLFWALLGFELRALLAK
jgi:hypothetical protein